MTSSLTKDEKAHEWETEHEGIWCPHCYGWGYVIQDQPKRLTCPRCHGQRKIHRDDATAAELTLAAGGYDARYGHVA